MAPILRAPEGFSATGRDGSAFMKWNPVPGAAGYRLFFYSADAPETLIKARYAQGTSKGILGFTNKREYLVEICAYTVKDGKETLGQRSEKKRFTPHVLRLKAQRVLCLKRGESGQISWESAMGMPPVSFSCDNPSVASVDGMGTVTAKSRGTANITLTSLNDSQTFVTKIAVDRNHSCAEKRAVLMFTGDLMCTSKQQRAAAKRGFDFHDTFRQLREILSGADFSAGVLETVCCDTQPYEYEQLRLEGGSPNCNSPTSFAAAAAYAGFDAMITANNHSCDCGMEGLTSTADAVRRCGMMNIGTLGDNPVMVDVKGIRAAILACTMISNGTEGLVGASGANPNGAYSREYFTEMVNHARSMGAEYIIAYMHWGAMNTPRLRKHQLEEAKFLADAGADLIVGSHPHLVQKFSWIGAADGRRVPCAFSLGNMLSAMSEIDGNRDGAVLRAELRRENGRIMTRVSYIPCMTEDRSWGYEIVPVFPPHNSESTASFERTKAVLGTGINHFEFRPLIFLSGSKLLNRIFSAGRGFRTDRTALLLSQLSLGCGKGAPAEVVEAVGDDERLRLDLDKDLADVMGESQADYCAVDFLAAAAAACYKLAGEPGEPPVFFTGSKSFKRSAFYKEHKERFTKINPPFGETVWKPLVERYAAQTLQAFPPEKIILFRHTFGVHSVKDNELRNAQPKNSINRFIRAMEDYFISIASPLVVDLSQHYFSDADGTMEYEDAYYADAYRAVAKLTDGSGRTCVSLPDESLWFDRVMKYYPSMTARAYQSWLLDMDCAADQIIAHTSAEFAGRNRERLLRLKHSGSASLMSVRDFFVGDSGAEEIIKAAEMIHALLNGHIDRSYDFFEPAFRGHYNIVRRMVRLLSNEIGASVNEDSAELAFLLRGKTQMKRYINSLNRMTLDIWGSCVSRESANRSRGAYIGTYIFKQSPILAFDPPVDVKLPEGTDAFCGNKWRRRTMEDSFLRSGDADIKGSESRWILLDFYDLISRMAEYRGGLFEIDDFILRTDFYKSIQPECRECYLFEKRDMKFCYEVMTRFAKMILEKYGEHIILIKTEPKNMYIDLDNRLKPLEDDGMFEIKKKFISLCEERFASVTGCYVIDISKHFYSSDSFPLGGAHIVHYEDEFYRQTGEYITEIISGSSRRVFSTVDDNYLLLRNLKLNR